MRVQSHSVISRWDDTCFSNPTLTIDTFTIIKSFHCINNIYDMVNICLGHPFILVQNIHCAYLCEKILKVYECVILL